jgi:hypothetical protein
MVECAKCKKKKAERWYCDDCWEGLMHEAYEFKKGLR